MGRHNRQRLIFLFLFFTFFFSKDVLYQDESLAVDDCTL